ncbi:putative multidrug resistance-associated protein lethal(2)03659 [Nymphon striatum]|nr:putative multidrug resistance-associated protein lethal(2)03659 [Nymphon striatum]
MSSACTNVWVRDQGNYIYPVEKIVFYCKIFLNVLHCGGGEDGDGDGGMMMMKTEFPIIISKETGGDLETYTEVLIKRISQQQTNYLCRYIIPVVNYTTYKIPRWTFPILRKGWKNNLKFEDYSEIPSNLKTKNLDEEFSKFYGMKKQSVWALIWTLFMITKNYVLTSWFWAIVMELVQKPLKPLLISLLLAEEQKKQDYKQSTALLYAMSTCFLILSRPVVYHQCLFKIGVAGMIVRSALSSAIYKKITRITQQGFMKTNTGEIMNILTNDMNRFTADLQYTIFVITSPLQCIIVSVILWYTIGALPVIGLLGFIIMIPLQILFGRILFKFRKKVLKATDARIKLIYEIISSMKIIKLYAWEDSFWKHVFEKRKHEFEQLRGIIMFKGASLVIQKSMVNVVILLSMFGFVLQNQDNLTVPKVYLAITMFNSVKYSISKFFGNGLNGIAQILSSIQRIYNLILDSSVFNQAYSISCDNNEDTRAHDIVIGIVAARLNSSFEMGDSENKQSGIRIVVPYTSPAGEFLRSSFAAVRMPNIIKTRESVHLKFLSIEEYPIEYPSETIQSFKEKLLIDSKLKPIVKLHKVYSSYGKDTENVVKDISFSLNPGDYLCVIGEVGSGKTSLLKTILKEMVVNSGTINVRGNIAYSCQQSWIFSDTLKNNILFGSKYDQERYQNIINACCLSMDINLMKYGDETVVGERGIKLSGGQRARISLARALYYDADVYLLDDPLSAVDAEVGNHLYLQYNIKSVYGTYETILEKLPNLTTFCTDSFKKSVTSTKEIKGEQAIFKRKEVDGVYKLDNIKEATGEILNRFTKDIGEIDEYIPEGYQDVLQQTIKCIVLILAVCLVEPYLFIVTCLMIVLAVFVAKIYTKTYTVLKRAENITKSPVFTHVSMTLDGLSTIRAYGALDRFRMQFHNLQDLNMASYYMYFSIQRWFCVYSEFIGSLMIFCITITPVLFHTALSASSIGFIISQLVHVTGAIQMRIITSLTLQSRFTSVERVLEYGAIHSEADRECAEEDTPPDNWPHRGSIFANNVSLAYDKNTCVLKDICFSINGGQKVGVIGRTGAGKTSLVNAIFRLAEPSGCLKIDGIDISKIGIHQLRRNISIIPQEPLLFKNTIRYNLDPFGFYNEAKLWSALESVELKAMVGQFPEKLDTTFTEGTNLSVGEQQLICLARAILKENKIIILDEATSSVDVITDKIIQKTIRTKFKDFTVITIAHRIHTIIDADVIMVIDNGYIIEMDSPKNLVQNKDSHFYKTILETGSSAPLLIKQCLG